VHEVGKLFFILENAEERHQVPIEVVVNFDGAGAFVEEHGSATAKHFDIGGMFGEEAVDAGGKVQFAPVPGQW